MSSQRALKKDSLMAIQMNEEEYDRLVMEFGGVQYKVEKAMMNICAYAAQEGQKEAFDAIADTFTIDGSLINKRVIQVQRRRADNSATLWGKSRNFNAGKYDFSPSFDGTGAGFRAVRSAGGFETKPGKSKDLRSLPVLDKEQTAFYVSTSDAVYYRVKGKRDNKGKERIARLSARSVAGMLMNEDVRPRIQSVMELAFVDGFDDIVLKTHKQLARAAAKAKKV